MKTFLRILIILAAALVVAGLTYALVSASSRTDPTSGQHQEGTTGRQFSPSGGITHGETPDSLGLGGRHGRGFLEGGSRFSWAETLKNIIIVAVLVLVVALIERLFRAASTRTAVRIPAGPSKPNGMK